MNGNTPPMTQPSTLTPTSTTSSPRSDFRNATIENHWNDPPKKIFHKSKDHEGDELDINDLKSRLDALVKNCQTTFTTGPNKRIADDTAKRIQAMLKEMDDEKVASNVVVSTNDICQALENKNWEKALDIHRQLMTTEYERHGSWVLGLKRLIDLSEKASSS